MQVATIFASAADTKTATPSWDSISDQICSARTIGSALALTSAARKSSSSEARSGGLANLALGMGTPNCESQASLTDSRGCNGLKVQHWNRHLHASVALRCGV